MAMFEPAGKSPLIDHVTSRRSITPTSNPPTSVHENERMRPIIAAVSESRSNFGPSAV